MRTISASEARTITELNIRNTVIDQIMFRIENAAKSGQYVLKIRSEYTDEEIKYIQETLTELGYNIEIKTQNYLGSFKQCTTININWHD